MGSIKYSDRFTNRARPVRVANCSGAAGDPGYQMLRQAELGEIDFITGDYLAEVNLAENAEAMAAGRHEGFQPTAWDGLQQTVGLASQKKIKIVINGGSLNPQGLAEKCEELVRELGLEMVVAYVSGDNRLSQVKDASVNGELPAHLDSLNENVVLAKHTKDLLDPSKVIVSANAYLGARAIVKGLEAGADIIICGRVADASPVIGAAWWWHGWQETNYDELAGALVAGHLIECSSYVTGSNFSGFDEYPIDQLIDLPFGIAEIASDGTVIITKHENTKGMVTVDTVKCQFLYELQGDVYLNSDVKAYLHDVDINEVGPNRIRLSGITGGPPPPTTKLAIFYRGGYESQLLLNAAGYATPRKFELWKRQLQYSLVKNGVFDKLDVLEFQHIGVPEQNPRNQLRSTTYLRLFAQASEQSPLKMLLSTFTEYGMQHYSGMHCSLDFRTAMPRPFLAYYPALISQDDLRETVSLLVAKNEVKVIDAGHPSNYEKLAERANYDTKSPVEVDVTSTKTVRLGDIALGRSGDKGANINLGVFIRDPLIWDWFRAYMSRSKLQELIGEDWRQSYYLERVEFPNIYAVHFVVYGILGRGVSSATNLDVLGKGFADFIRDREIELPSSLWDRTQRKPTLPLEGEK